MTEIEQLLTEQLNDFEPKEITEELNDWRTFNTGDEITIEGNSLRVEMNVSYTKYEPSEVERCIKSTREQ